jgi:hypothetical protein
MKFGLVVVGAIFALPVSLAATVSDPDPQDAAFRMLTQLVSQPFSSDLWSWAYGPAIEMSAMWEISRDFPGQSGWTSALNDRLNNGFINNASSIAWQILHNVTIPWTSAIGDVVGLMPIAFLSRADYYRAHPDEGPGYDNTTDLLLATLVADEYVLKWPYRLPDGVTISRNDGWPGEPNVNASFLWDDDQFMGTTLLARLILVGAPNSAAYADFIAQTQVNMAKYMQDPTTGVFPHGYNHATGDISCCRWGRANG